MAGHFKSIALIIGVGLSLAACATDWPAGPRLAGTMRPYQVGGVWYRPHAQPDYDQKGLASWYGHESRSRTTADGEIFDTGQVTGAHRTLPLPSIVEVTNLDNGRRLRVRLNDRGPFSAGRIIDLSPKAAKELDFYGKGMARVRVRYVGPAGRAVAPEPPPPTLGVAPPRSESPAPMAAPVVVAETAASPSPCRIQAGAFADAANARRAAERYPAGSAASIETVDRGGTQLYRVTVACAAG